MTGTISFFGFASASIIVVVTGVLTKKLIQPKIKFYINHTNSTGITRLEFGPEAAPKYLSCGYEIYRIPDGEEYNMTKFMKSEYATEKILIRAIQNDWIKKEDIPEEKRTDTVQRVLSSKNTCFYQILSSFWPTFSIGSSKSDKA